MTTDRPERWLPVVEYEDHYQVSDQGRVRSVDRLVGDRRLRGVPLKPGRTVNGYRFVVLCVEGVKRNHRVHRLVLQSFIGPCPVGMEALHWDDDQDNNALSNLRWGTKAENMQDQLRNGRRRRTKCQRGHAFTPENLTPHGRQRLCKTCRNDWLRSRRLRKKLAGVSV